jgi:hypothetical protein
MPNNHSGKDPNDQNPLTDPSIISSIDLEEPLKSMFIVGNGKIDEDMSPIIDKADVVIRFNDMLNYDIGTGTKTSFWVLSSNKFLINQHITKQSIGTNTNLSVKEMIDSSQCLLFSIPPFYPIQADVQRSMFLNIVSHDKKERIESVLRFLKHFGAADHSYRIIEFPDKYVLDIAPEIWAPNWTCPSNGYLITRMMIDDPTYYKYKKYLVGFSWEGLDAHPWVLEKLCIERLERDNLITIVK